MGVELQHCAVYGYRFDGRIPWDKMYREDEYDDDHVNRLMDYGDHEASKGDFVLYQDPRGDNYLIAGVVHFLTDSTRWNGPQIIEPTVMDEPEPALVEAMEQTINEEFPEYIERKTDEPEHIVFTHNW
jgi:hypothetical protein